MEKETSVKYYTSYISCKLSTLTGYYITVAQIFIKNDDASIMISEKKMKLLKKIIPKHLYKFFKYYLDSYKANEKKLTYQKIDRDHRYFNGMFKVHKPSGMTLDSIEDVDIWMNKLFLKYVDDYFTNI